MFNNLLDIKQNLRLSCWLSEDEILLVFNIRFGLYYKRNENLGIELQKLK